MPSDEVLVKPCAVGEELLAAILEARRELADEAKSVRRQHVIRCKHGRPDDTQAVRERRVDGPVGRAVHRTPTDR